MLGPARQVYDLAAPRKKLYFERGYGTALSLGNICDNNKRRSRMTWLSGTGAGGGSSSNTGRSHPNIRINFIGFTRQCKDHCKDDTPPTLEHFFMIKLLSKTICNQSLWRNKHSKMIGKSFWTMCSERLLTSFLSISSGEQVTEPLR